MKIVARGSETWFLVWELGRDSLTQKRKQRTETFHGSREDAEKRWRVVQVEIDRGYRENPAQWTVAMVADRWVQDILSRQVRRTTLQSYQFILHQYVLPRWGTVVLKNITAFDIDQWYQELLQRGGTDGRPLSSRTVHYTHHVWHRVLQQAVRWQLLDRNPTDDVTAPRVTKPTLHVWSVQELQQYWQFAQGDPLAVAFWLALTVGLRRGEILGLRWEDIDWEKATIRIAQNLSWMPREGIVIQTPKTWASRRVLPVGENTLTLFRWQQERQARDRSRAHGTYQDHGLVVQTRNGHPIGPRNFLRSHQRIVRLAGLPYIRIHDLRHSYATLLITQQVSPRIVADRLGHVSVSFTLDTYTHLNSETQRALSQRAEQLLLNPFTEENPAGS